ncbi:hypothetical protein [Sphingomonas bacterium]|uniref:hypothetical protein n=1 Tax=Sphingomonas bacterium TaxID=1895847 RepID=UPI0015759500|nr:hypothetical protein [Sphingomonas bacterium]
MKAFDKLGRCLLTLATLLAGGPAIGQAVSEQQWPPPGVSYYGDRNAPDISGLWLGTAMAPPGGAPATNSGATADGRPPLYLTPWPLPYTPAYKKIVADRTAAAKQGRAIGDIGARCLPFGLPAMLTNKNYPDEIVQTPGEVTIFMYNTFPIVIWTDGRGHPKDLKPSYNGHSVGYWVGDTLFVDTVGINASTPMDGAHDPHSAKLHLKWSIERVAPDVIHTHITFYDDEAFTEPVTTTNIWQRKTTRTWEVLDDASCFENASAFSDKTPEPGFIKF